MSSGKSSVQSMCQQKSVQSMCPSQSVHAMLGTWTITMDYSACFTPCTDFDIKCKSSKGVTWTSTTFKFEWLSDPRITKTWFHKWWPFAWCDYLLKLTISAHFAVSKSLVETAKKLFSSSALPAINENYLATLNSFHPPSAFLPDITAHPSSTHYHAKGLFSPTITEFSYTRSDTSCKRMPRVFWDEYRTASQAVFWFQCLNVLQCSQKQKTILAIQKEVVQKWFDMPGNFNMAVVLWRWYSTSLLCFDHDFLADTGSPTKTQKLWLDLVPLFHPP